jgi:tetratricopeptide (TPR) repeat protein/tRNA A-37 threonylcarbamoyl transferase component Bud32
MTPEAYERLWVIFEEIREHAPAERDRLLDERCGEDGALRAEVKKLLAHSNGQGTELLDDPGPLNLKMHLRPRTRELPTSRISGLDEAPSPADAAAIGQRFGPYEIQKRLGEGGMGCVYLAVRREHYDERVAIKWIKPGLDTEDILRRFHQERQLLAALRHPNIAALLDGGTLDSRPYFVMEYVDGSPIDTYCAGLGRRVPDCVRLFQVVCMAVHHAHQNLVLHRDLKPGNILVDATGAPKLLDFGIARVLTAEDETQPDAKTRTGHVYATPEYASPEHLTGTSTPNITSDIYSLGVILYEMLTGHRPFETTDRAGYALLRSICEDEPTPPRLWRPDLPFDLEVICLRCLHKSPARRFPSAASLAEELTRFLEDRPIQSRPAGVWERTGKWVRRRPAAAGLLAISVAALLAAVGFGLVYNRQLAHAVVAEAQAKNRLQQEIDRADANLLVTLGLLEKKLVGGNTADRREWLDRQKRREMEDLLARFQVLEHINHENPALVPPLAQAYEQMGTVQEQLGEFSRAEQSLVRALELERQSHTDSRSSSEFEMNLGNTFHKLGRVRANAGHDRDAEGAYREAITLHRKLVTGLPGLSRDALARDLHNLGNLLARSPERHAEATSAYEEAIRLHEQLVREAPNPNYEDALNNHRYRLRVLQGAGLDEKERNARKKIADLQKLASRHPLDSAQKHDLAMQYHELGKLLALRAREIAAAARRGDDNRPSEIDTIAVDAEEAFERAVQLHEGLVHDFSDVPRYQRGLAQHYVNLGDLFLWTARQSQRSRAPYQAAVELFQHLAANDPAFEGDLGWTYEKLGQAWLHLPEPDRVAASECFQKAVEHLQVALKSTPDNAHYRKALAEATKAVGEMK